MKKVILLLTCALFLYAGESIVNKESSIMENNKEIGYITVLTSVKLIKEDKGIATIKLKGWRNENYPQQIVRDMKRAEVYAEIKDEKKALNLFKVLNTIEDEYGEIWQEVEGVLRVKQENLVTDKKALYEKAKKTYTQTCSMCHRLHEAKSFTVSQWPHQIETMMEQVALEKPIKNLIVKYLQQNAKDSK